MQIFVIDWQDVLVDSSDLPTYLAATYQPLLVSGTSIKTINGQSLLGAGNIAISVDLSGYLPIAGGTLTGSIDMDGNSLLNADTVSAVVIDKNGLPVATEAFASNASNLSTGQVSDNRLSSNVPRLNAANTFTAAQSFGSTGQTSINASGQLAVGGTQTTFGPAGSGRSYINTSAGLALGSGLPITWSTNVDAGAAGADASIRRNSTGPTLETRAAGGLKVCNADGSAVGPVQCSDITVASGSQIRSSGAQASRLYFTDGFGLGSGFNFAGYNTPNPAFSMYMDASGAWVLRQRSASWIAWTDNGGTAGAGSAITSMISQASAGVLQIGTTSNNALGSLNLANLTASGTTTLGTTVGTNPLVVSCGVWGWLNIGSTTGPTRALIQTSSSSTGIEITGAGSAPVYLQNGLGRVLIGTTTDDGSSKLQVSGNIIASGQIQGLFRPTQFTVATLPSAAANTGRTVQVTDSSVDFPGNIGNTVAGGGAFNVDVKSNGTNWRITG